MATEAITKRGVLVADHSAHMAALIADMLRTLGRKDIREVTDADGAMSELRRRVFDVIILDDDLDGMNGVALTKKLRAATDSPNRLVPIVMMSTAPDARRIAEARDAGVTEFLRKPFAASHLQARLTNIENNPRGFIEAAEYKGPDRRRKTIYVGANDRRESSKLF